MKFGTNLTHGVEKLWLTFGEFSMGRSWDIDFSLLGGAAGQLGEKRMFACFLLVKWLVPLLFWSFNKIRSAGPCIGVSALVLGWVQSKLGWLTKCFKWFNHLIHNVYGLILLFKSLNPLDIILLMIM